MRLFLGADHQLRHCSPFDGKRSTGHTTSLREWTSAGEGKVGSALRSSLLSVLIPDLSSEIFLYRNEFVTELLGLARSIQLAGLIQRK